LADDVLCDDHDPDHLVPSVRAALSPDGGRTRECDRDARALRLSRGIQRIFSGLGCCGRMVPVRPNPASDDRAVRWTEEMGALCLLKPPMTRLPHRAVGPGYRSPPLTTGGAHERCGTQYPRSCCGPPLSSSCHRLSMPSRFP